MVANAIVRRKNGMIPAKHTEQEREHADVSARLATAEAATEGLVDAVDLLLDGPSRRREPFQTNSVVLIELREAHLKLKCVRRSDPHY